MQPAVKSGAGSRRRLYPPIEPYEQGMLDVGDGHSIYWECSGNPNGHPVLFLHGGPGGATSPVQRRFFDPSFYRIVLVDQRGCGRSRPHASIEHNTTQHLLADLDRLRRHLRISRWLLFGGSWGSTLALLYAQADPDRMAGLILRGIFLSRKHEIDWFYKEGANRIFPEAWSRFVDPIPLAERDDLIAAYYSRLTGPDEGVVRAAAREWSRWERSAVTLAADLRPPGGEADGFAKAIARLECHYFFHGGFLSQDDQILARMSRIAHVPGVIVQGRYDIVCPPVSAYELAKAWPSANLKMVPIAGHSAFEPDIVHELVHATDEFRG